ncbi:MAG: hypothetical protein ABIJ75_02610 [Actinomycetota bacterium]
MRRTLTVLTLGLVLGALLMAALPGGAVGQSLLLGQRNSERVVTRLDTKGGLRIDGKRAGSPPLILNPIDWATPPMEVNSNAKVVNLNADLLDGRDSASLRHLIAHDEETNIADNINWSPSVRTITTTVPGTLLMSGTVDFYNNKADADWVDCMFKVNGAVLDWSRMTVYVQPYQRAICHSTGIWFVATGDTTVQFITAGLSVASIEADNGTWWVLFAPD